MGKARLPRPMLHRRQIPLPQGRCHEASRQITMETPLKFPLEIYPPSLRKIVTDTHKDLNFPVNYIAASLLLAASVAVGNSRILKVKDGWRVKSILYMALVGSPGAVKTHPISFALSPLRKSDDRTLSRYAHELDAYRRQPMTDRAEKPQAKQFIVKDSTIEAIAKVLDSNSHGICVHSDELNGFLFRILFVNNSSEGVAMLWPDEDLPSGAEDEWSYFMNSLLESSKPYDEDGTPTEYTFDPTAWTIIRNWQNLKEEELAENGEEYQIAIFRKIQDYALRFCLLIHAIRETAHEIPSSTVIDALSVIRATKLAEYFYQTALEIYENIQYSGNGDVSRIITLLNNLPETFSKQQAVKVGELLGISRSTITRHIRGDNDDPFTFKVKHGIYRKIL